ncbi:leukotoxin LktA family filamentous adhesin [Microbacteriaceae bacterium K1510]|nr:leukotoxin LktA family filamentous adhesin [Microbacteriaceae bacterium K1510]
MKVAKKAVMDLRVRATSRLLLLSSTCATPPRLLIDAFSLRVSAAAMAVVMTLSPVMTFAQSVPAGVNRIVPDGRTATTVTTNGSVSTVTTNTISGANAFNTFSQFQIGRGATGNLVAPNGTSNLINLLNSNDPAVINGVLNGYQNGQIGGNIYFAAPGGFVVGSSGTVNVGSLSVSTPTREFVDGVINHAGQINQGSVDNLLAGTVPLSPDGNIRIRGRINAVDAVRLTGQNVSIGTRDAVNRDHATKFASTVNSKGLQSGSRIVVRNGSIQIVAGTDANVNGRLSAHRGSVSINAGRNATIGNKANISVASKNGNGGSIAVNAGQDIKVAGYGVLSAKSTNGNAGTIRLIAQRNLDVTPDATFDASSAQGDGGLVELSAFGHLNLPAGIKVKVGAPNGQAGYLLIDPTEMTISATAVGGAGGYTNADVQGWVDSVDAGGTLILCAGSGGGNCNGTFTLAAGGVIDGRRTAGGVVNVSIAANEIDIYGTIDTRLYSGAAVSDLLSASNKTSTGNSGSVTLTAPTILIGSTGKIFADVNNATGTGATSYTAGNVNLVASLSDSKFVGETSATTSISIGGTIAAANITATATSTATTSFISSTPTTVEWGAIAILGAITGISGGYLKAGASAKVTVEGTAHLTASGAITLSSVGSERAEDPAVALALASAQSVIGAAVVVGIVNADIATQVKSGATISSGNFTAIASNNANLNVTAQAFSTASSVDGALAYTTGTVNTRATIDPGVVFNKVGNVVVGAQNTNSFSTSASSIGAGTATAAVAVAISDVTTNAVANLGASLPQTANAGAVTVYSGSNTTSNAVFASTTVGSNFLTAGIVEKLRGGTSIGDIFAQGGAFDSSGAGQAAGRNGTITNVRGGVTLSLNLSSMSSTASIANIAPNDDGDMVAVSGNGPTIYTSGAVAVISSLTDAGIRGSASSTVNSPDPTTTNTGTGSGVSMAVNVDQLTHNSNAYIGSGVTISAPTVGVRADTTSPITITWLDFDSFSAVTSHISGSFGVSGDILTSYANSTFDSSTLAPSPNSLAGAVNYFQITNNTTAWIASGAHITQTGGGSCAQSTSACWTTNLSSAGLAGAPSSSFSWNDNVAVIATTTTETINVGGNFSWLKFFGTTSGPTGTALGGSANVNIFNTNTVAGIGAGAIINATNGTVAVSATTKDLIYAVSPTSGSGSGLGLNGIASVLQIDNHTSASVSNLAQVTAQRLEVDAEQDISSFNVGGAVGASSASGFGVVVALGKVSTDTNAFIGDNSTVLSLTGATGDDSHVAAGGAGYVDANTVNVAALSVGRLTTVAVAAQSANNTPLVDPPPGFPSTKPADAGFLDTVAAFFVDGGIAVLLKLTNTYNSLTTDVSGPVQGGNVTAGAGSAAVDLTSIGTHASINGATIRYGAGSASSVSVQALNNTIIDTASGAAALSKGAPGTEYKVGMAGAVAVTLSGDMTTATISGSTVTAHSIAVQALAGGESTTIGLAVAMTAGSGNGYEASASVSVAEINNGVQALVDSSTLGDAATGSLANIAIIADQVTNIGIGAGSLYAGFTGYPQDSSIGFGVAMTYASIGDPTSGAAVSAVLANSKVQYTQNLTVEALDSSRIISGAAVGGGGPNASGFAGSVVVNDINPTVLAEITSVPAVSGTAAVTGGITVAGDITVNALSGSNATLDAIINGAAIAANGGLTAPASNSGLSFAATDVSPDSATGAAIIAVAGNVQLGKANVGVSIVVNRIGTRHLALIDKATVTSTAGVVDVSARDDAEIIGVAIGVGAATGKIAGNGSVVYNAINNAVVAQIGHGADASDAVGTATATVDAAAVRVSAQDSATIRGAAGAISLNFGGGDAIGLSAAVNQIGTFVSAGIVGATVTADNTANAHSALFSGNLQSGSVVVAGSSTATITTVSIGAAMSVGNPAPQVSPQSNLSSLVAAMRPATPSALTGFGGGGVTPPTPPQPPAAASTPSNGLAGAGSLALSMESTTVYSTIDQGGNNTGASVTANNNVLVLASNTDSIAAYAGAGSIAVDSGKGIGASVVVNTIDGTTSAGIANSTVDARAAGTAATIDSGILANDIDPSAVVTPGQAPSLANSTSSMKGVAVVSTSQQKAVTVALVFAASTSGLAVSANAVTNVMGGTTEAQITSSSINTNLSSGQVSAVQVTASSASFANILDLGMSDSASGAAGTAALVINTLDRTTKANIDSTNIGSSSVAAGAVGVFANAFQGTAAEVVGAAGSGSSAAVTGTALTNLYQSETTATFDHGTVYASSLDVVAEGKNGFFGAVGAGSIASSLAVGATVLVAMMENTVTARVGDHDASTAATTLNLSGALNVLASNDTDINSYTVVGAVGGSGGIATQFSGLFIANNVSAELDNAVTTANGGVTVAALETDSLAPVVGGLSGGGSVGVGAAVNLVMLKSSTAALVAGGSISATNAAVTVSALSTRDVNPITAVLSLAGSVGIAGTVGVVIVGTGASTEQMSVLNSGADSNDPNSGTLGNASTATGTNLIGEVAGGVDGISAQILSTNVTSGAIGVGASARTAVRNIAGAAAIGTGVTGEGAAVAITEVDQQVTAKTSGGTLTAPIIAVTASAGDHGSGHTAESIGASGAGGYYLGIGAAVGKARVDNTVIAELGSRTDGGATGSTAGSLTVSASDTSTLAASGYGLGIGLAAVGLSLAFTEKASSITADIAASTTVTNFDGVMVIANAAGGLNSYTLAGSGGSISGAGATSTANDAETVIAKIGAGSSVTADDAGILVSATATPNVSTSAIGVAIGNVSIGASEAMSHVTTHVTASVEDNATIAGGPLTIAAAALVPTSGHSANAFAVGSGGGMMLGLQASYAQAANSSYVTAYGGKNLHLPTANVTIAAENDTNQLAAATGISAAYYAAGATIAQTSSFTRTNAYLDTGAVMTDRTNHGVLAITATGSDSNTANATAGSGGFVAGAAAIASTSADNTTVAELRGDSTATTRDTLYFGGIGINAQHSATYAANGDAYQASAVGASGGSATNDVLSNVTAAVGPNLEVNSAGGNMNVISSDSVSQTSGGSRAGSGGILAGAATLSQATVTQNVASNIGTNTILSLNDDPLTSTALLNIEAYNFLDTTDTVNMTVGSLFAGGGAYSKMDATAHTSVNIADNAHLFSAGNIAIGTAAVMTARNNANGSFYGLVSGGSVTSDSVMNAYQNVTVGDATIEAWGVINIYAGQSGDGSYTTAIKSNGTTTVYNYTVSSIVAGTVPHWGAATANSYTTLTLGTGSQVLGANNVFVGATPGATAANGQGSLYSPFLEIFSSVDRDNRGRTPITSGDVVLNGLVAAGIHNQDVITISYDGVVSLSGGWNCSTVGHCLTLEQVSGTDQFNPIMSWNRQVIQYTVLAGFNPKQDVVNQIANLSGLTAAQVTAAIAAGQTITAQNDDAAGTKQRQIDTYVQQLPYMTDQNGSAYAFGNITGSAGNVSILANTITGNVVNGVTPSVTARDSALISVDNQGVNFLFMSALTLSSITGGRINFVGGAQDSDIQGHVNLSRDLANQTPTIALNASWSAMNDSRQPIDRAGHLLITTPDIYLGGVVTNVSGLLNVTNLLGNVLITRDIRAGTVVMTVPNGLIGGNLGANSVYNSNFDVASQWTGVEYRPTDVLTAVYAAATYLGMYGNGDGSLAIGGNWSMYPYYYYTNQGGYTGTSAPVTSTCFQGLLCNPSTVFTARMLAAYYDGAHNNSPSLYSWIFLPVGEGVTPSAGGTAASWVRNQYLNQAYSGDSGPFNYATGGNFFQVVQIQNQVVNGVQADTANNTSTSTIQAGKALILSASAININGTLEVGQSSNYSVNIGANAQSRIQWIKDNSLAQAQSAAAAGRYVDLTDYVTTVNSSDVKVTAYYNALTDQILLSPVVQGSGGYVYLNGRILSTSTSGESQGNIIVHGGAGTVTVNNTTGTELVTNVINTGVSAASVVEIVDRAQNKTTWYVYNAGAPANQQVTTYTVNSVTAGSYAGLTGTTSANSGLRYQVADQLYQWTDTASLSRAATSDMSVFGWHFDTIGSAYQTIDNIYSRSAPQVVYGTQGSNFQETVSAWGSYTGYQVSTGSGACCGTDFHGTWYQERFDHLILTLNNSVKANYAIGVSFTGGGTSNIAVTSNASVIVNGSINNLQGNTTITTTGANSAIVGGAAPFISGVSVALNGEGGVGSMTAPIPIATYGGTFSATSIDRDIAVTATGGLNVVQVKANPRSGGTSQGNIYISATGDITSASAYNPASPIIVGKSIEIDSSGGAIGARSGVDSSGLAILTDINPIVIQASATLLSNGTYDGGLLNSTSANGTYIIQSSGDLRIGEVSSHGSVLLAAWGADGRAASILNGTKSDGLTAEQSAYLASVWQNLNLQGDGSGVPASVTAYQQMINAAYNEYWQLRNIINADGSISALGAQMIATQLAAKLNKTVAEVTTDQIQAEVTLRLAKDKYLLGITAAEVAANLHVDVSQVTAEQVAAALPLLSDGTRMTLDQLFGTTSGATGKFQWAVATTQLTDALTPTGYSSSFRYTLPTTSALYASLATGAQWSLDQLTYTVSPGANPENGIPAPALDASQPNVSGRQVMLYARNGNIGSLATPATFTFRSDDASNLTDAQKTLLASAGPGQLTVTTTDVPGTNGQVKQYTVSIAQQSLLVVDPLGPVSANAKSQIYLGSASDLKLGGIPIDAYGPVTQAYAAGVYTAQSGDVVLHAVGSILGGVAGQVAISGNVARLTLIADHGSIGQAPDANNDPTLLLALTNPNGMVDQADAAKGIYLRQTTGDLILGNINAGSGTDGVLQLSATGDIYAESQFTDRSAVHIVATTFDVRAGGDIGFNGAGFQPLQVKISGAITGSAGGKISILSPTSSMTIGALSAIGALTLDTDVGGITINGNVSAGGLLTLLANGGVIISAGTDTAPTTVSSSADGVTIISATLSMGNYTDINAAGLISVTTTGDAVLGRLTSSLVFAATGGNAIVVTAGGVTDGAILSNGDGRDNVRTLGANARVALSASTNIGASTARLVFDTPTASIAAARGNVFANSVAALHLTSGVATLGSFDITGSAGLTLDSLTAGTQLAVRSTGGAIDIGTATSGGSQTIRAAQGVTFTTLTATGITGDAGDVAVAADAGAIQGTTVTTNGSARLVAATTNKGTTVTATTGLISVTGGGLVDWTTLNAGTTINVLSSNDAVNLGTTTSGGSQSILAAHDVTFDELTTTGVAHDAGDVTVTSNLGAIQGTTVAANGSATLTAATTNKGTSVTATTGSIGLAAGGLIDWTTLNAGTTIGVRSTGDTVNLSTATSGGAQTIRAAQDVTFARLTSTGITGDVGDISVTADAGLIQGTTVAANGSATLMAATTNKGTDITATTGSIGLTAGGLIDWATLTAGTTLGVRSTGDTVNLGTVTSGGTQTIRAAQDVTFNRLTSTGITGDAGDVSVTADAGLIQGTTVAANGSATLTAATTNKGTTVTATTGSIGLTAGGLIDWTTLNAGTTIGIRSTGDSVHLDTTTSGGSQTIRAANNVTFTELTTTGITGDVGDVSVTADAGLIQGTTVAANGSATLTAATTNKGTTVTATTGSIGLTAGGLIDWATLTAGTTIGVRSTGDSVNLGTATSGGSQTIRAAQNVTFDELTTTSVTGDVGDVSVTADAGFIQGTTVAANGSATLTAATTNKGTEVTATTGSVNLTAGGFINWTTLTAGTSLGVRSSADSVNLGTATSGGTQTIRAAQDVTFGQITTNGITGNVGDVSVTADAGFIQGTTVAANGSATLTAATTNKGTDITATTGSIGLTAAGLIDWSSLTAGTSIGVHSTAASVNVGTATSGGAQTIRAAQDVTFTRLTSTGITGDIGDVSVTADAGLIQGTTVAANGSATLTAATTNKGTTLTARTGVVNLAASGLIDWATLNADTAINVHSTADAVNLGTTTSGGTQTIRAAQNVTFGQLTANGIPGDVGDIFVTADTGAIHGTTLTANGSATLIAATDNVGDALTARTGDAVLRAGGLIHWNTIAAGKTLLAESAGNSIQFGTAVSGGSQTLRAWNDIVFNRLMTTGTATDAGDITLQAINGQVRGTEILANGNLDIAGRTHLTFDTLQGSAVTLRTPQDITVGLLNVYRSLTLQADTMNVIAKQLPSMPPVPLHVTISGFNGGVARSANLNIDPPQVIVDQYHVVDSVLVVDSPNLTITDGYVPGQLSLTTPAGEILLNNRTPAPTGGVNLQLYQPGGLFSMQQIGNANFSNTYVVWYDTTIASYITRDVADTTGGTSFVRDTLQDMRNGGAFEPLQAEKSGLATFYLLGGQALGLRDRIVLPVEVLGDGPAVNLEGMFGRKTPSSKRNRANSRSTELGKGNGVRLAGGSR